MGLLRIDVPRWRSGAWVLCSALVLSACGGGSDSQVGTPGGGGATGGNAGAAATGGNGGVVPDGSPAGAGGNGGSAGMGGVAGGGATGGTGTGGSATADASGSGGSSPGVDGGASCPALASLTLAVHQVLQVSWPSTVGTNAGTGVAHIWNRTKLAGSGAVSGDETAGCGTSLPSFMLGGVGAIFTGQGTIQIDVPDAAWDQPTMPKFHSQGTIASFNVGGAVHIDPTVALVGFTMADPMGAWPASYTGITTKVDADGDGKDGFTAVPHTGTGFVNPPIGIGQQDMADKLYLVSRNVIGLDGTFTACETISGTAHVTFFDNHVVGCHTTGGADCTTTANGQAAFVDSNRTIYTVTGATFTAKRVPDTASCADVRAALPL